MKIITTDFFSTIDIDLAKLSFKLLFCKKIEKREENLCLQKLESYTSISKQNMYFFLNARSALYHCLKAYEVGKWDEVIITGWNCISVVNLVLQTGARPVYCDISRDDFAMSLASFQKRISPQIKLIILQETFWIPGNFDEIIEYANRKGIPVIMDGAHSFWNPINPNVDAYVYSFARDKLLSTVNGGLLTYKWNTPDYIKKLDLEEVSNKEIRKHLYYNVFWYLACKSYNFFKLGKIIMAWARNMKVFPEILSASEKDCDFQDFSFAYPKELYPLLLIELEKYQSIEEKRKKLGELYISGLRESKLFWFPPKVSLGNFFRVPLLILSSERELQLRKNLVWYMKHYKVYLWTTWSGTSIAPVWSNTTKAWVGDYPVPVAQDMAENMVFLPNHRNMREEDVQRIIELLLEFETYYV